MPISNWSTTASANATADSANGVNWSEGQAPSSINDSARAMMAVIKGDFANSLAGNGYQRFPNGLILQWTTVSGGTGTTSITWPTAFPTECYGAVGGTSSGAGSVVLSSDVFNITVVGCSVGRSFSGGSSVAASGHSVIIFALGK